MLKLIHNLIRVLEMLQALCSGQPFTFTLYVSHFKSGDPPYYWEHIFNDMRVLQRQ